MAKKTLDVTFKLSDQFTAPMRRIINGFRRLQRRSSDSLKRMGLGFKNLLRSVVSLRAAIGGLIAVWGVRRFWGALMQTVNYVDEIQKLGIQTGEATEWLSKMRFVLEQSGNSWAGFQVALRRGARNIKDATEGIGSAYEAFNELGVTLFNREGQLLKMSELLPIMAKRFESMGDETRKAALAADIFGRSGAEMLRFLNFGSQEIERLQRQAEMLGVAVGQDAADNIAAFKDSMNALGHAVRAVWRGLVVNVMPGLTQVINELAAAISFRREDIIEEWSEIGQRITQIVSWIGQKFIDLSATMSAAFARIEEVFVKVELSLLSFYSSLLSTDNILVAMWGDLMATNEQWEDFQWYVQGVHKEVGILGERLEDLDKQIAEGNADIENRRQALKAWTEEFLILLNSFTRGPEERENQLTLTFDRLEAFGPQFKESLTVGMQAFVTFQNLGRDVANSLVSSFEKVGNAIADSMIDGFENFEETVKNILADLGREITRLLVRMALFRMLGMAFGLTGGGGGGGGGFTPQFPGQAMSNRGNVFTNARGGIEANQQGGIYRVPGLFRSAVNQGIGSIAERGPEAILPLFRRNGILGVASQGSGVTQNVTINAAGMDRQELLDALRMHGAELTRTVNHTYRQHSGLRGEARQVVGA